MQLNIKRFLGAITLAAACAALPAQAQQAQGQPNFTPEQMQQIQALQQQGQEIQQEIAALQEQVMEGNPELAKRNDEIQEMAMKTMRDAGYDPEKNLEHLQTLQAEYKAEGTSEERKGELQQEFQKNKAELQEAQQLAMSDPEVQQARKDLRSDLLKAMEAANPEFPSMMKALGEVESQVREVLLAAQSGASESVD